ncbi:MAG: hypothetical protein HKN44_10835 [Ilumatobacter sp.]|nr:hypothetical protein [Ilumatobacter sp.]
MSDRRNPRLLGVKLRTLVAEHLGTPIDADPDSLPNGVALRDGDAAWVIVDGDAQRSLGAVLAWALRRDARTLHVVAEVGGGTLARRASAFTTPISVWFAEERTLLPVVAEPLAPPPPASAEHLGFTARIADAGAEPNVEHGVVFGEVRGLEVCRVVDRPTVGFLAEPGVDPVVSPLADGVQLEVGVGGADREAFHMLHGELPTSEALAAVVATVSRYRSAVDRPHPLNRLGRERLLRWHAVQYPGRIGLAELAAAEPPIRRPNLKDPVPCVATGARDNGDRIAVVFSAGVDLDLVPYVADVQAMYGIPVIAAVPERDDIAMTRDLAGQLVEPIEFVALDL